MNENIVVTPFNSYMVSSRINMKHIRGREFTKRMKKLNSTPKTNCKFRKSVCGKRFIQEFYFLGARIRHICKENEDVTKKTEVWNLSGSWLVFGTGNALNGFTSFLIYPAGLKVVPPSLGRCENTQVAAPIVLYCYRIKP
ncbi:hypothetical protein CBL_11867 [Carabus blaptoides fortunei]